MGAGALTVIILKTISFFDPNFTVNDVIPGLLANLIVLIGSYYLLPKVPHTGWVGIKEKAPLIIDAKRKGRKRREFIRKLKAFDLLRYLQNSLLRGVFIFYSFFTFLFYQNIPLLGIICFLYYTSTSLNRGMYGCHLCYYN